MKRNTRLIVIMVITFLCSSALLPFNVQSQTEHNMQNMGPMNMVMVDGYTLNYSFQTSEEHRKMMTDMKMDPSAMKMNPQATHHFSIELKGADGKSVNDSVIRAKIIDPDQKDQTKWAEFSKEMNHYGCDFVMQKKGKYGVIVLFKTADDKKHVAKFWYELK